MFHPYVLESLRPLAFNFRVGFCLFVCLFVCVCLCVCLFVCVIFTVCYLYCMLSLSVYCFTLTSPTDVAVDWSCSAPRKLRTSSVSVQVASQPFPYPCCCRLVASVIVARVVRVYTCFYVNLLQNTRVRIICIHLNFVIFSSECSANIFSI